MHKYILYFALFLRCLGYAQFLTCDTNWTLPMKPPLELSSGFGDLRPNHFHMGLDVRTGGKENLPIFAIADGYVSRIKVSAYGYGWVLYVSHPNGYTSVYAHCNRFSDPIQRVYLDTSMSLKNNEIDIELPKNILPVRKGELIAYSGNTGGSGGPHLHFELRDAHAEHALNPLLHGFKVSDSGQPLLSGIRVYAIDPNGFEVPGKSLPVQLQQKNHKATLPLGFLREGDRIGIAIQVDDFFTIGGRSLGLFSAEVWTAEAGHFGFELDKIEFEASRYINVHQDFEVAQATKKKFQKLFRSKINPLTIYPYEGLGSFEIGSNDSIQFSLMLRDVNGNESLHQLWVTNPYTKVAAKETYAIQTHWMPSEVYHYETDLWRIHIDSFTFFEPVRKSIDMKTKSIGTSRTQLARPFELRYQGKDSTEVLHYVITMNGSALPTARVGGQLIAESKSLGVFGLRKDETPPILQDQGNNQFDRLNNGKWTWVLKDDFSGIASYGCWQDDKWIPAYFDAKNQQLKANFKVPFKPGTKIVVRVKDAAGNERVYQRSAPLAPLR
jgi:hypothetical protein